MKKAHLSRGMSLVEILIVIAILGALAYVAVINYSSAKEAATLNSGVDAVYFALEQAKADALAGKNGEAQGVKFNNDSFVRFGGVNYDGGDGGNIDYNLDEELTLSTTLSGDETIVFSRLTGSFGSTATVTVALINDNDVFRQLVVGPLGDIERVEN